MVHKMKRQNVLKKVKWIWYNYTCAWKHAPIHSDIIHNKDIRSAFMQIIGYAMNINQQVAISERRLTCWHRFSLSIFVIPGANKLGKAWIIRKMLLTLSEKWCRMEATDERIFIQHQLWSFALYGRGIFAFQYQRWDRKTEEVAYGTVWI